MQGLASDLPLVVVVDNDFISQQILKKTIESMNCRYDGQTLACDIVQVLRVQSPALVILDLTEPGASCLEILCSIKQSENNQGIMVLGLINATNSANLHLVFDNGMDDYALKPLQFIELQAKIKKLIDFSFTKNQLIQETKIKQKLFSLISHDLRSPFSSMIGVMQLLIGDYANMTDQDRLEFLQAILDNSLQQINLLDNLTYWSWGQSKRHALSIQTIPLAALVNEIVTGLQAMSQEKKQTIVLEIDGLLHINSDADLVKAILRHVLHNAIKFSALGSTIRVFAKQESNNLIVAVENPGPASESLRARLENNPLSSTAGTNGEKGNGIGLDICQKLANRLNGQIIVGKNDDSGTIIGLQLTL